MDNKNRQTLSICMIVKNEEEFIEGALESVQDIADQIVILDTGSTDGTIKIAKKYDTEIHYFEWQDDFSAARNESIKYAEEDWILWIDADERLVDKSKNKLRKLLKPEEKPVIYKVNIKNYQEAGNSFYLSDAHRLFNNNQGIYFTGIIHEQLSPSVKKLNGEERESDIILEHYGYSLEQERAQEKNQRNKKLLNKMIEEHPKNSYAHFTLAQYYQKSDQTLKAEKHYKKALEIGGLDTSMKCTLLNMLSDNALDRKEWEDAESYVRESLELEPDQATGFYLLYKIYNRRENYKKAREYIDKLIKKSDHISDYGKNISNDVLIDKDELLYTKGNLLLKTGEFSQAKEIFEKLWKEDQQNKFLIKKLIDTNLLEENISKVEKLLNHLKNINKEDLDYLENIAEYLLKNKLFELAIKFYIKILNADSNNINAIKKLAGLYGKLGQREKAVEYVKKLQQIKNGSVA